MLKTLMARSAIIAFACSISVSAYAIADGTRRAINIPSGELATGLEMLAKQSDADLVYRPEQVQGFKTGGVSGELSTEEAVTKLIAGTPLILSTDSTGAMLIALPTASGSNNAPQGSAGTPERTKSFWSRLRLAQSEAPPSQGERTGGEQGAKEGARSSLEKIELEEIVVTGTHIRGTSLPPAGSRIISLDRAEIARRGYATVQDALNTLTENFKGSGGGTVSETGGATINLRGLGADSTLVLIDGRRQAPAGIFDGSIVDISSIAASAVERIEVLPDGASAIYGSDAVGGVVNIILRKDYQGAETQLWHGTYGGDADEDRLSQLLGISWDTGNVLVGYQFYKREPLARVDRPIVSTADFRPFGGSDFRSNRSVPGNILCPPAGIVGVCASSQPMFAIPDGQDGRSLTTAELLPGVTNFQPIGPQEDLLPQQRMHSAFITASQSLAPGWRLFAEGRFSTREFQMRANGDIAAFNVPNTNPFFIDPFGGRTSTRVSYNFLRDLGPLTSSSTTDTHSEALGLDVDIPHGWKATLTGSYAEERSRLKVENFRNPQTFPAAIADSDPATAFNPFGDGGDNNPATLDAIRFTQRADLTSQVEGANLVLDGPVLALPAGDVKLAAGADHRRETIVPASLTDLDIGLRSADTSRNVNAAFLEFAVPLVSATNPMPAVRNLDLSLAARYEDYSDFGNTTNPKVGLSWAPLESFTVRGTWGKSFKAPRLIDLLTDPNANINNQSFILNVADPSSPTSFSDVLFRFGGNANLKPERAETWTAGLEVAPTAVPGLNLAATYFDIDYRDRVATGGPSAFMSVLTQESLWAQIIARNPSQAEVDAICNAPGGFCAGQTADAIADFRLNNLARVHENGVDAQASQRLETSFGTMEFGFNGTYVFSLKRQVSANAPEVETVDTVSRLPRLRLRGLLSWQGQMIGGSAAINYLGGMIDNLSTPSRSISSWTTVDLRLSYQAPLGSGWSDNVEVALSAVNAFDREPPFVNIQGAGYDAVNANDFGRLVSLQITKGW